MKNYDHLNFSRAFVVQFRASWYITLWIGHPCEKLWPFKFLESFRWSITSVLIYYALESDTLVKSYDHLNFLRASVVQFRASRYIICPNRKSIWKDRTILITRELPLFNFDHHDIFCAWIGHPCEKLWPFKFIEGICRSISSISIYYAPKSHIWVKGYENLNFSRASVVQSRASRYIMSPNRTFIWKDWTIWISREIPLFNFDHHDILCARIRNPRKKLWPFEFLERFRCSILSVSIY